MANENNHTGWQCPICKGVYGPHIERCANCKSNEQRTIGFAVDQTQKREEVTDGQENKRT